MLNSFLTREILFGGRPIRDGRPKEVTGFFRF